MATNMYTQAQICNDISNTTHLEYYGYPVNINNEIRPSKYTTVSRSISRLIHNLHESPSPSARNGYMKKKFKVIRFYHGNFDMDPVSYFKIDYALACWLKSKTQNKLLPFYVSKAYDELKGIHNHRFIFMETDDSDEKMENEEDDSEGTLYHGEIMLVDGAAQTYIKPDFNIELHYLELRKHNHSGMYTIMTH